VRIPWRFVIAFALLLLTGAAIDFLQRPPPPRPERARPGKLSKKLPPSKPQEPDGPWRQEFESLWRERGRKMTEAYPWLLRKTIWLLADEGVPTDIMEQTRDSLQEGLAEIGARRFEILMESGFFPQELKACVKDTILNFPCYKKVVPDLRTLYPKYSGSILMILTNAAIEADPNNKRAPFTITSASGPSPKVKSVPPAGMTSYEHGFAVVSEWWSVYTRSYSGSYSPERRHKWRMEARRHAMAARHELYHVFGMPHHVEIHNPGFGDPVYCSECHETKPSHAGAPHLECTMVCGGMGVDNRKHHEKYGKHYGLCAKCLTAARSLVDGIVGR